MDESRINPEVGYEQKDIRLGCLLSVIVASGIAIAVTGYSVWRFYWWQADTQAAASRSPYAAPSPSATRLPPTPRLEEIDRLARSDAPDFARTLATQEQMLHSRGATDEAGFVHIPIQEAIKALAGNLPVRERPDSGAAKDAGLTSAGEPNSGRLFRGGSQ